MWVPSLCTRSVSKSCALNTVIYFSILQGRRRSQKSKDYIKGASSRHLLSCCEFSYNIIIVHPDKAHFPQPSIQDHNHGRFRVYGCRSTIFTRDLARSGSSHNHNSCPINTSRPTLCRERAKHHSPVRLLLFTDVTTSYRELRLLPTSTDQAVRAEVEIDRPVERSKQQTFRCH